MFKNVPRIAVVTRETRLQGIVQRWGTRGQANFLFKRNKAVAAVQRGDLEATALNTQSGDDEDFLDMEREDDTYQDAIKQLVRDLDFGIPVQTIDRRYLPNYDFGMCEAVVVVGQDGLVANTAKYVGEVPIVGVNPDPQRFDGVLLPYGLSQARRAVELVLRGAARVKSVTLAQATLHDGQTLLAFNDLFIGAQTHESARYELEVDGRRESQSSSGILVSTGAGSSGWMSSVGNMARGVLSAMGVPTPPADWLRLPWDARALVWAVREPFLSRTSGVDLVAGKLGEGRELIVESRMPVRGVIFSDGVESDRLEFNGGAIARIGIAPQRATLVVG